MARRFDLSHTLHQRWAAAAIAAGTPLLACGPGGPGDESFRVTQVEFDGDSTITLTFSQPIANADAIDPNDFRISLGRTSRSSYTNPQTGVTEVSQFTFYEDIGWLGDYDYDYYAPAPTFTFTSASLGGPPRELRLEGIAGYLAPACAFVTYYSNAYEQYDYPGFDTDIALFVHYAGQDVPLESDNGEALADIGADWVIDTPEYIQLDAYGFVNLRPKLEIPCPP